MAGGNIILVNRTTQTTGGVMVLTGLPQTANTSTAYYSRGGPLMWFDATWHLFGTIASTSTVNVQYTLDPSWQADLAAGVANVFVTVTTLTLGTQYTLVTEHAYAVRLNNSSTSTNDNYGIAVAWADKR